MIKIENRFTGDVILETESLRCANLRGANLRGADLQGADLWDANLWDANLWGANLRGANLRGANLRGADLRGADLRGANLRGANLRGANLWGVVGNKDEVKSTSIFEEYDVTYTSTHLQIGCQRHEIADWWNFSDAEIFDMDGDTALLFWQRNKQLIRQIVETKPAKPTGVEDNESE